jgi:signal transduction histidine kinase
MQNHRVGASLFLTVLVLTAMPLIAAFYLLDDTLQTSLNLGFNQQVLRALEAGTENLKTLRDLDPQRHEHYRNQFAELEELKYVYSNPALVKDGIRGSLKIYFGFGLLAAVSLSVLVAVFLSRRIARAYTLAFEELTRQRDKVRYLEEISSWQELAKVLAHEIKNPLTPIEVLVTSLSRSYLNKNQEDFQEQLRQTETMVTEELGHLKHIVNRFGEFAKLPQVQLVDENLTEVIDRHLKAISGMFDAAEFQFNHTTVPDGIHVKIDSVLFRQVLLNIVRNGVEANPDIKVVFIVQLTIKGNAVHVTIQNDGKPVPADLIPRMFDPYVSGKHGKDNMGLGLAIVRKIIIEHGGDISYGEENRRPVFAISLPTYQ